MAADMQNDAGRPIRPTSVAGLAMTAGSNFVTNKSGASSRTQFYVRTLTLQDTRRIHIVLIIENQFALPRSWQDRKIVYRLASSTRAVVMTGLPSTTAGCWIVVLLSLTQPAVGASKDGAARVHTMTSTGACLRQKEHEATDCFADID